MDNKFEVGQAAYVQRGNATLKGTVVKVSPSGQATVEYHSGGTDRVMPTGRVMGSGYAQAHTNVERGELEVLLDSHGRTLQNSRIRLKSIGEQLIGIWQISGRSDGKGEDVIKLGEEAVAIGNVMLAANLACQDARQKISELRSW